ncbi:hypothetical protein DH2020_045168 [Rehmannia glutinosa]|uniref:F-box domain-containing protein n=1 Tax=Rehmannia glutinosa TaxID=99300 RepID=A0ABR0UFZ6_REHGL
MISQLPQPILHRILSFLSQKEAVQTCVLSKSWRYLGPTRLRIEFRLNHFGGNKETFMSVLNKTLQGYLDHKLCIQEFLVEMSNIDSNRFKLLEKWISIFTRNKDIKTFDLGFILNELAYLYPRYFDLSLVVFEAEPLRELYLKRCKLSRNPVLFKHLQTLSLAKVHITDETFDKIMSSCPLIEHVVLHSCEGLRTIKVNNHHNLNYFDFCACAVQSDDDYCSIEIDAPSLETLKIVGCPNWYHDHKYFPRLKSLYLGDVRLSSLSFDILLSSCNYLKYLTLQNCYGFKELHILSGSVKHLSIIGMCQYMTKSTIDAPNMVEFEYEGGFPRSISFARTSGEWKSNIKLMSFVDFDHNVSSWFRAPTVQPDTNIYGGLHKPIVVVEQLRLSISGRLSCSGSANFMNGLFRICRPRNISVRKCGTYWDKSYLRLNEFLCKVLVTEREKHCFFLATVFGGSIDGSLKSSMVKNCMVSTCRRNVYHCHCEHSILQTKYPFSIEMDRELRSRVFESYYIPYNSSAALVKQS